MVACLTLAQARLLIEDREDGWVFPEQWFRERFGDVKADELADVG
jgi:hypothetical protein